jgi:hypothetical protein
MNTLRTPFSASQKSDGNEKRRLHHASRLMPLKE